ncbi:Cysteine desulfuration protein SufE [Polystyrenella longa]|uniref:Cysteine desulfuration protein SufE n=1 Tax=Polystyrenella longa TaxID=2528007 RepID=A0A518CJG1_9PLAN|nr:SufE family protein [Polystyrenella longa]QDU79366.1 Cysteine desulfuration protein SufE [Polystyrenella longa]
MSTVTLEEIYEDFEDLSDWEARCDYLIDLGFELPDFPVEEKTEENRVHGCQSMVWLTAELNKEQQPPVMAIQADSDAMIVKGLIGVILAIYSNRPPEEVIKTDVEEIFAKLGLTRHLSPARRNGLFGMVKRIRQLAIEQLSEES